MSGDDYTTAQGLTQKSIIKLLHACKQTLEAKVGAKRKVLYAAINRAAELRTSLPDVREAATSKVDDLVLAARSDLQALKADYDAKYAAFEAFRSNHGRIALPRTHSSLITVLICGVMVAVEAGVNASFLLNASLSGGALSALVLSTTISGTNVIVSTCAGFFIGRWMDWGVSTQKPNEPQFARSRKRAKALFQVFLAVIGGFHITVGLVRAQGELHQIKHGLDEYLQLLTTPESLFLVLAGGCMSALAFYKGKHGFGDAYPKYGSMYQAVIDAREKLLDCRDDYIEEIEARFDELKEDHSKRLESVIAQCKAYNEAVSACNQASDDLREEVSSTELELRAEFSEIVCQYQLGLQNKKIDIDKGELNSLCRVEAGLERDLPDYVPTPAPQSFDSDFEAAKQNALVRLHEMTRFLTQED